MGLSVSQASKYNFDVFSYIDVSPKEDASKQILTRLMERDGATSRCRVEERDGRGEDEEEDANYELVQLSVI